MAYPKGKARPAASGRKAGTPNKATADVRATIAAIAERNAAKVEKWLERTARTQPAKAADLYLRLIEYHLPKLGRTEITGPDGGPLQVAINDPTRRAHKSAE